MAKNTKNQSEDPEVIIENALGRSEQFIEKNGKMLLIALTVVVLAVGGYFAYLNLYKAPQKEKAAAAMFEAQYQFEQEDYDVALKGSASFAGFEEIAKKYSSLPQGNIAKHYAGLCNLYLGNFKEALSYFESFSSVEGSVGKLLTAQNFGLMGDTYVELGDMANGAKMYEKAAGYDDNIATSPKYLKKAAMVNVSLGNLKQALDQYNKIKSDYPASVLARDIDMYIAMVEQKL